MDLMGTAIYTKVIQSEQIQLESKDGRLLVQFK